MMQSMQVSKKVMSIDMKFPILFVIFISAVISTTYSGDFSIGPRIITQKKVWSEQELLLYIQHSRGDLTSLFLATAYGLTENTGFQITIPIIMHDKVDNRSRAGLGNLILQGQWQFYKQPSNMGVFNAGVRVPTRTIKKSTIDSGSVASYIFDVSGIHSSEDWYAQVRAIVLATPRNDKVKPGDTLFYVLSAGPKLNFKNSSLFSTLALRGIHAADTKVSGSPISTGGDVIFFGPQFGCKRKTLTFGGAFGWPIMQRVESPLPRFDWFGAFLFQVDF